MTNLLAILHTTAAYQAAVVQLMVGEANFAARQLGIREDVPSDTNALVEFQVNPPPLGVGGSIVTTNYLFSFDHGRLSSLTKRDWFKRLSPPASNMLDLARQPSLLDTNGAYQLATQRLAGISVDASLLEQKWPVHIFQVPARRTGPDGRNLPGKTNLIGVPLFQITWGDKKPPMDAFNPVRIKLLGTTREVLEFNLRDPSISRRPPLVLTNADELLGPLPPPRHFVQELIGGKSSYQTVASPDRIEASLLNQFSDEGTERLSPRSKPFAVPTAQATRLSALLVDFDSYAWTLQKMCSLDYGVKLTFIRKEQRIDVLLCLECDWLSFRADGREKGENFDFVHDDLARIVKELFPRDERIQKLETETDSREQAERTFKRLLPSSKP